MHCTFHVDSLETAYDGTIQREKELEKMVLDREHKFEEFAKENENLRVTLEKYKKKIKAVAQSQDRIKKQQEDMEDLQAKLESLQKGFQLIRQPNFSEQTPKNQTIKGLRESVNTKDEFIMSLEAQLAKVSHESFD